MTGSESRVPRVDGAIVIEADNLPEVVDRATAVLMPPGGGTIYQRGDVLTNLVVHERSAEDREEQTTDQKRGFRLVVLDADSLAQCVNRTVPGQIFRRDRRNNELRTCNFPPAAARTMIAERRYQFEQLLAIAETPLLLPDGSLLDRPGYEGGVLLHFVPEDFDLQRLRGALDGDDVDAALAYLRQLLSGFPFVPGTSSESVALALLMTAVLRPILPAAPGFGISARAPGTGKTHLARLAQLIATGRDYAVNAWPGDENEVSKLLLSVLIGGAPALVIDNLNGVMRSDSLCVLLTSPLFEQRILGESRVASVPTRVLVVVNGNNLVIAGDLVRRFLVCQMDAGVERPETRRFEFDPAGRLLAERAHYVGAVLTIARAYLKSDWRPNVAPFAGFEQWSRMVREPLLFAGMPDPVASIEASAELDPDLQQLRAMLLACRDLGVRHDFDLATLVRTAKADRLAGEDGDLEAKQRRALREAIEDIALRHGEISNRALGQWFARVEGRLAIGLRFVRAQDGRTNVGNRWRLEQVA